MNRALLDRSLAHIVRRLRTRRVMHDAAAAACGVAGALLLYQLALTAIAPGRAVDALRWLLVVAVAVALAWFVLRLTRRVSTVDAAAVADRAADLKDEIKSAWWLTADDVLAADGALAARSRDDANRGSREFIGLLVQRATASAQRLDARQVVPTPAPRSLMVACAMALLAMALAWWSPRLPQRVDAAAESVVQGSPATKASTRADRSADAAAAAKVLSAAADQAAANAAGKPPRAGEIDWAGLERAAASFGHSENAHALAAAIRERDVRKAAELLEELKHEAAAQTQGDRSFAAVARPMRERAGQADAGAGRDLLSAVGDMFRAVVNQVGLDASKSAEDNIKKAMQAAEQRAQQSNVPSPPTKGGNPDNANSAGPRPQGDDGEARVNGQGEGNNPGGNSQVADGSGQHVSLSDGADGSNPGDIVQSRSLADVAPAPVEGVKTQRLQVQLQRVRIDGQQQQGEAAPNEGAEERLYAATRAQRSSLDYQAAASAPRAAKEDATTGERVPLAHREVVRDYFLNLRRKEKSEQ